MRTLEGNRVWATVPQDKKALSNEERSAIENYLGLRINDIPEVSDKDVICWGLYVEKFFPGDYTKTNEAFKIKLPDPSSGVEKQFTLVLDGKTNEKLVFSKKVTVGGALVWTVPKTHQKTVAKLFDLSMKNFTITSPKDAIYILGKKAQGFWVEAGTTEAGCKKFNTLIKEEKIFSPYDFMEQYMTLANGDKRCRVYLGEDEDKRFWWVPRKDYKIATEILELTPKDRAVRPETGNIDLYSQLDLLELIRQDLHGTSTVYTCDRDDGTNDLGLQSIRGGRGTAQVRKVLEPKKKK